MLINYEFSNYRSIGTEPIKISFEASKDKSISSNLIDGEDILKGVFIFGSNATGKSSIISSFEKLQDIVLFSFREREEKKSHALYRNDISTYKLAFSTKGVRYDYCLNYTGQTINAESLYFSPNGRTTKIFEREGESFSFGPQFNKDCSNCDGALRPNHTLLNVAFRVTRIEPVHSAYLFFRSIITFVDRKRVSMIEQRVGEYLTTEHPENKDKILFIVRKGCPDIEDMIIDKYEEKIPRLHRFSEDDDFADNEKEDITRIRYEVSIKHSRFILPFPNESSGTLHLFRMAIALSRIMGKDRILLCDEPELSLNSNVVKSIFEYFMSDSNKTAQVFCSSHATELLDLKLLRRDQIYFTSIEPKDRTTRLERLSDRNGIRTTEKVEQNYLKGMYDSIQN